MAIILPDNEKLLERLTAFVAGRSQEFVLTDRAVYYEGQRSPITMWISAVLMPLATLLGLGALFVYLRGGRLFVRHSLERVDAVTVRRVPLSWIATSGGLLALLFGLIAVIKTHNQAPDEGWLWSIWIGYLVAIGICLVTSLALLKVQLTSMSVNAVNGNFTFDTYRSFEEMQRVQNRIWQARAEWMSILMPPMQFPRPEAPDEPERRAKRR